MTHRKLTPDEETKLIDEVERLRQGDGGWDFARPKRVVIPPDATVPVTVRLPLAQYMALREAAASRRVHVSDLVDEAIRDLAANCAAVPPSEPRSSK